MKNDKLKCKTIELRQPCPEQTLLGGDPPAGGGAERLMAHGGNVSAQGTE
ncbi:MAG: hypothetical protein AAB629_02170 [Patescibacteria group bacterium]